MGKQQQNQVVIRFQICIFDILNTAETSLKDVIDTL